MHRPFLAMALLQNPENPFESAYSPSVLAAQNSASFIIQTAARYMDKAPDSILRFWDMWIYLPSAAVRTPLISSGTLRELTLFLLWLSAVLGHCRFDRDSCSQYAIQCNERLGSCDKDLGERCGLFVVREGSACKWEKILQRSAFAASDHRRIFSFIQPYVRQMCQMANNPTPSVELSNGPMAAVPPRTESGEPCAVDGNKNKDDLYLFTRGQVFRKSSWRSSAPLRPLTYSGPSAGMLKLPAQDFASYSDSGFSTPNLTLLSFAGQQDAFPSYSSHGSSHGYHSATSTPGIPASVPSLDMFPFGGADQLPLFGSTTNATTSVDGEGPHDSSSWLQQFGVQGGPPIGYTR